MLVKHNNASQLDLSCVKKCLTYYPAINGSSSISSKMSTARRQQTPIVNNNNNNNSISQIKQESQVSATHQQIDTAIISCEKCQSRCVIIEICFSHFSLKWLSLSRGVVCALICTDYLSWERCEIIINTNITFTAPNRLRKVHTWCVRASTLSNWLIWNGKSINWNDPIQSNPHIILSFKIGSAENLNSHFGNCDWAHWAMAAVIGFSFGSALIWFQSFAFGLWLSKYYYVCKKFRLCFVSLRNH